MDNITTTIPVAYVTTTVAVNRNPEADRKFWMNRRQILLNEVDNIERALKIKPRTSKLRHLDREKRNG